MKKMLHNKRGQIGETLTWVVAVVVIIVMIGIYIYLASLIVKPGDTLMGRYMGKFFRQPAGADLFAHQSVVSYLLAPENSNAVYESIRTSGDFDSYNGNLAKVLFNKLYGSYYSEIYLGVSSSSGGISDNSYFTVPGPLVTRPTTGNIGSPKTTYEINLGNGKILNAIFSGAAQQ